MHVSRGMDGDSVLNPNFLALPLCFGLLPFVVVVLVDELTKHLGSCHSLDVFPSCLLDFNKATPLGKACGAVVALESQFVTLHITDLPLLLFS